MKYQQLLLKVIHLSCFLLFLLCFFLPNKVYLNNSSVANLSYLIYSKNNQIVLSCFFLLFIILIFLYLKNVKIIKLIPIITSVLMIIFSLYYIYDGIFTVEKYDIIFQKTILGIGPILMFIFSSMFLFISLKSEKIISKIKISNNLIKKVIIILFSICLLFSFLMPLAKDKVLWPICDRIGAMILWEWGLITFIVVITFFLIKIIFHKKLTLLYFNITIFIFFLISLILFYYASIELIMVYGKGFIRIEMALPYITILTILSFFIYLKNEWLNDENINKRLVE